MTDTPSPDEPRPDTADALDPETLTRAKATFTQALPKIRNKARFYFRHLPADLREDAVAETEAFAWKAFLKLTARGRDPAPLAGKIAEFAARRVRSGERFAGKVPVRDALSDESRLRHGYHVTSLPRGEDDEPAAEVRDALCQRGASPAEEAIARLDYEAWLDGLKDDHQAIVRDLASGFNQKKVAELHGRSKGGIQQIVSRLRKDYDQFQGGVRGGKPRLTRSRGRTSEGQWGLQERSEASRGRFCPFVRGFASRSSGQVLRHGNDQASKRKGRRSDPPSAKLVFGRASYVADLRSGR